MTLHSVIIADDSAACNIADLCVQLKDSTARSLNQYKTSHPDVGLNSNECLSSNVTKHNLSEHLARVNSENFACFWYGHGKQHSFIVGDEEIVTTTENHYIFSNALIYTFSCLNGGELADMLIQNQTKTFVGYNGVANCPYGLDDITTEIVMSFIDSFLSGKTANEAKADLVAAYERSIFDDSLDPLQRSRFQENRDNIVIKGDGNLTVGDLIVEEM